MTITAIDPVVADMMLMAELNRLLLFEVLACDVRRSRKLGVKVERSDRQYNNHHHTDPRNVVCTLIKELRHSFLSSRVSLQYLKSH
jgi:hypothetical protein